MRKMMSTEDVTEIDPVMRGTISPIFPLSGDIFSIIYLNMCIMFNLYFNTHKFQNICRLLTGVVYFHFKIVYGTFPSDLFFHF